MGYKVIDLHCDTVFHLMEGKDLLKSVKDAHVDLPRLKAGKVGLQVFAAYVPPDTEIDKAFLCATKVLDLIDTFAGANESLSPVETASELKAILNEDRIGIMTAVENGLAIEESLEKLEKLRRRNVRIMTLVHSQHMSWIESCTGSEKFRSDNGRALGSFGEKVVDAMNDLGIIPDVSHSSENAFWDVIKRSKKPIIASHSCAYKICAARRNLKDDQLKALGDTGGLVGINFASSFLSDAYRQAFDARFKMGSAINMWEMIALATEISVPVPQSIIADHIDHIVNIAGENCVAMGSDFDGIPSAPEGVSGCDFFPVLEDELRKRGYSEKRIEKIFNGNFLRVLEEWG